MFNVLYVEDDADSRAVMTLLQRVSPELINTTIFADSADFEEKLLALQPQPDLILLDIHMKPHTGFEMFSMIRQHRAFDNTPIVAVTASVMNNEVQLLKTTGFSGILAKPLNMEKFPSQLERIMAHESIWYIW